MIALQAEDFGWGADMAGEYLVIRSPRAKEIIRLLDKGKKYVIEIKQARKKRSLDANAYMWVLVDKIAEALRMPKSEIYRRAVRDLGGNAEVVCVKREAADTFCRHWEAHGLGWLAEQFPSRFSDCVDVELICGSSVYDSETMARLIDSLIEDARALDIETMTPQELARLEGYGK